MVDKVVQIESEEWASYLSKVVRTFLPFPFPLSPHPPLPYTDMSTLPLLHPPNHFYNQRAEKEARALASALETVKRIQFERGEDEETMVEDPELLRKVLSGARAEEGLPPLPEDLAAAAAAAAPTSQKDGQDGDDEDGADEYGGDSWGESKTGGSGSKGSGGGGGAKVAAVKFIGVGGGGSASSPSVAAVTEDPPAPRKKLTCVLFADSNTHVLLTGDSSGRVDVYRLQGVAYPNEDTDTSGRVDSLMAAISTLVNNQE